MKFKLVTLPLILLIGLLSMCSNDYNEGSTYHGFKLIEKRFVKEVNAECYYFKHEKSGASLFKIASDDANKTFTIAFKTDPETDAGTPHIMEHSVLNGSKKFPVKSPFDVLSKTSLNTFINAFTGDDMTAYPVASKNEKDYFNLMDVYLDAVFNPLIYSDPRILKQEGWHYELTSKDAPVEYRGIVYNEMKGAYSSATRELGYHVQKNLYPNTNYQYSSGGYPPSIPTLSYKQFLDYHTKYYHPSNSHIFLYGNASLDKELEFIDREYLAGYENTNVKVELPLQESFDKMKNLSAYYPVTDGADTKDQTFLTLNYVTGLNTDTKLVYALDVLTDVLVNQESAPIRLALQKAGIGRDYNSHYDDLQQVFFQIRATNANPEDKQKFIDIVTNTLKDVVKNGVDKAAVEGTLNRKEFNLREGNDAQKGLNYAFSLINGWFFADDPFLGIEYEKPLAELKQSIKDGYLEEVIQKYFLENTHILALDLQPKPGLEKEINEKSEKELAAYKASLNDEEIDQLVKETEELIAYQKEEDTPEALASIPMLEKKDINPKAEWYGIEEKNIDGVKLLFHENFTNNVVYTRFMYDVRVLPQELIPYSALLVEVLGSLNTENYSYGELDNALNTHTGGFSTFLNTYLEKLSDDNLIPKFTVESKAMNGKLDKLVDLVSEIVNKSKLDDVERVKSVLVRHQARLDADVQQNGVYYAMRREKSYRSNDGMFIELTQGSEYYWFISDLAKNFDTESDKIIANLVKTAELLFTKENLIVGVTGSRDDFSNFNNELKRYVAAQPEGAANLNNWHFDLVQKNEGLETASKVQYAVMGGDYKKLGYEYSGKMRVLQMILSRDWLYNRIRVIGGAYGGFSRFSPNGSMFFGSYRDPNLDQTIKTYRETPQFLHDFKAEEKDMLGYIIGTIGGMDTPETPSQQGNIAMRDYFQKSTAADAQKERDEVLAVTADDIRNYEKMISDIVNENNFCVYGSEEIIKENEKLFGSLVKLLRKQ
ncbi:MAG: insulinase family protein [Bacteroidetes bacterium]|nr:insulinase family protein [Bacteroidota bacterium]